MRIAFVAKGGSGKTTVSSLFIRYALFKNKQVTAIDGDMNQHLAEALNIKSEVSNLKDLGNNEARLREILMGNATHIEQVDQLIETTPPSSGAHLFTSNTPSPVWDEFSYKNDNLRFLSAGVFTNENLAETCYHTYTGAATMLLNYFIDSKDEYVVVDMTAGADPYTSGMFSRFDMIFLVVEPTVKSLAVYDQCIQYGEEYGVPLYVVGNKVENEEDLEFIKNKVGENFVGYMEASNFVRNQEKGRFSSVENLEEHNKLTLEKLMAIVDNTEKDWDKYQKLGEDFHKVKAESWGNLFCGGDLTKQIDENFSYKQTAINMGAL